MVFDNVGLILETYKETLKNLHIFLCTYTLQTPYHASSCTLATLEIPFALPTEPAKSWF